MGVNRRQTDVEGLTVRSYRAPEQIQASNTRGKGKAGRERVNCNNKIILSFG